MQEAGNQRGMFRAKQAPRRMGLAEKVERGKVEAHGWVQAAAHALKARRPLERNAKSTSVFSRLFLRSKGLVIES